MKAVDLLNLLREFYRDKLALYRRHVAAARHISHYDFNNTYQYVIAREDVQLAWLRDAITDMAGELEDVALRAARVISVCGPHAVAGAATRRSAASASAGRLTSRRRGPAATPRTAAARR